MKGSIQNPFLLETISQLKRSKICTIEHLYKDKNDKGVFYQLDCKLRLFNTEDNRFVSLSILLYDDVGCFPTVLCRDKLFNRQFSSPEFINEAFYQDPLYGNQLCINKSVFARWDNKSSLLTLLKIIKQFLTFLILKHYGDKPFEITTIINKPTYPLYYPLIPYSEIENERIILKTDHNFFSSATYHQHIVCLETINPSFPTTNIPILQQLFFYNIYMHLKYASQYVLKARGICVSQFGNISFVTDYYSDAIQYNLEKFKNNISDLYIS
ncbi:hypothetical protein WA158_005012 [Blastocystis sp. Blastoise]